MDLVTLFGPALSASTRSSSPRDRGLAMRKGATAKASEVAASSIVVICIAVGRPVCDEAPRTTRSRSRAFPGAPSIALAQQAQTGSSSHQRSEPRGIDYVDVRSRVQNSARSELPWVRSVSVMS
jgi:hypothetical protein